MSGERNTTAELRGHRVLLACVVTYLAGFTMYGIATSAKLTYAYAVIVIVLGIVLTAVHVRVGFSDRVLWAFALWGLLHMAGGLIAFGPKDVLYNVDWGVPFLRYDRLVHAFGFGTTTIACWQAIRNKLGITVPNTTVVVMVWFGGMGLGALNEVVEFIMSQTIDTNVGGFVNTGYDLIFNTIGTAAAAWWVRTRGGSTGLRS
jgi:hypothetical protein